MNSHAPCIVIDARDVSPSMSGIGRYVAGLLRGLRELDPPEPIRALTLPAHESLVRRCIDGAPNMTTETCDCSPWSVRNQLDLPRRLRAMNAAVYHCPYVYAPLLAHRVRTMITVHDLIPLVCAEYLRASRKGRFRHAWKFWCSRQYAKADLIVTVSEHSKRDLVQYAGVKAQKILRIYNGVDRSAAATDRDTLRARWNLRRRIICTVSRHDPYKNLAGLVRAFARLPRDLRETCTLVITGRADARFQEPQRLARELNLTDCVVFTDYINDADRAGLLRMSELFVYPSLYEGFGLPPLEAMAEGVPVICSSASSLPEVAGDAAVLLDPHNEQAMADAIVRVLTDASLAQRLRQLGPARAASFSWRSCASAHLEA
jgi:alpha-1,3-rhamnosyl/mannosyltransferase